MLTLKYGKIRVLVTLHDFKGWDASALWEAEELYEKSSSDDSAPAVCARHRPLPAATPPLA